MKEMIKSFIEMYNEFLLMASLQTKSHAMKKGYDPETVTDVHLIPKDKQLLVFYNVKPQEDDFVDDPDELHIMRFVFETV